MRLIFPPSPLSIPCPAERLSGVRSGSTTIEEGTMKYVCLIYLQEEALNAMPKTEFDARVAECLAYSDEIRKSGQYVTSEALQPAHTATTVRVRNGKLSFAETKEQLGGFFLIDVRDLNDAIQVASRMPQARVGRRQDEGTRVGWCFLGGDSIFVSRMSI
jgi:hypothetical protein